MLKFLDTIRGHRLQYAPMIFPGSDRHESRILRIADQSHSLPRNAQPRLNLGAYGNPLHITAQHLRQKLVPLMPPVKTDLFTKKATADAKPERRCCCQNRSGPLLFTQVTIAPAFHVVPSDP